MWPAPCAILCKALADGIGTGKKVEQAAAPLAGPAGCGAGWRAPQTDETAEEGARFLAPRQKPHAPVQPAARNSFSPNMNTPKNLILTCLFLVSGLALCPGALEQETVAAQLTDGTMVKGEVVSWDEANLSIKSALGTLVINKEKLAPKTLEELKRWAARNQFDPQSAKREELVAKIQELDAVVASLRKDNAALREQLSGGSGSDSAEAAGAAIGQQGAPSQASGATSAAKSVKVFWISKSGKRHNENCKYFKTGSGREGRANQGQACKICGG